jgi:hypothetical protein
MGQPHHRVTWPAPGPRSLVVRPPGPPPDAAPSPIKTTRWEKPKDLINFLETHHDLPPSSTRDQEGPEALPGTLPERESPPEVFFIAMLASGVMSE